MTNEEINGLLKDLFEHRRKFERTLSQKQKRAFNDYWNLLQELPLYAVINAVEDTQAQLRATEKRLEDLKNEE